MKKRIKDSKLFIRLVFQFILVVVAVSSGRKKQNKFNKNVEVRGQKIIIIIIIIATLQDTRYIKITQKDGRQ